MNWTWIVIAEFVLVAWIAFLFAYFQVRRSQLRSEEKLRVLERLGTGKELADFLASDTGKQFLQAFAETRKRDPGRFMAVAIWPGTVFLFVWLAVLFLSQVEGVGRGERLLAAGVVWCALGAAFLLAGAIASRVSRNGAKPASGEDQGFGSPV